MTYILMHIVSHVDIALLHPSHRRMFLLCGVHAMRQKQHEQQQHSLFELYVK